MVGKGANQKRVKDGRFGARAIVAEAITGNTVIDSQVADAPNIASSILHIPRVGLDHISKAKIATTKRYFLAERHRSASLRERIKLLEADAILSNQRLADVEELLHVSRGVNIRRLRLAKRGEALAKTSATRKAAECAKRIRAKAATSLQVVRNMHREEVTRRQRELDDACRRNMENEVKRMHELNAMHEAAIHNKHHNDVDQVNKLRDAEIAALKKQHEVEQDKLNKTLNRVLQKSNIACATKRHKTHNGLPKFHPPPPDETRSKYDYIRHQSIKLKLFIDAN